MTKIQLDNLIKFSFNFHKTMGCSLKEHSADYLLEKWNKYIGTKPNAIKLPTRKYIIENKHLHNDDIVEWISRWNIQTEYDQVKEILNFILLINSKYFPTEKNRKELTNTWSVSDLIRAYKTTIGDPNLINNEPYSHLHALLIKSMNEWLKNDVETMRDYTLNTIV